VLDDDSAQRLEFKLAHHGLRTFIDAESIALPPLADAHPLHAARRTHRRFAGAPVPLESLAALLGALGERTVSGDALPRRLHPSAGDTYPIQVYVHVKAQCVDGLDAGTYYYDPAAHRLMLIARGAVIDRELHAPNNRTAFDESAFSIFLVAEMNAIAPLYGALARDFALLEAGFIGQLLMTAAAQTGLALCPIGTVQAAPIATILQLGASHELLHSFVGGRPADAAQQRPMTIIEELRAHLRARLPEFMVPADVVVLSEMPLSANGKVDRSRLPAPRAERPRTAASPSSETARTLARVAAEILGVDAIAPDDNFFDAGANSLHMVQLHRRIGEELHAEIPLVDLFRHPTVHFLAERLGEQDGKHSIADEGRRRAEARLAAKQRRNS
jgi:SagB-type dehydrogenase family enzyme